MEPESAGTELCPVVLLFAIGLFAVALHHQAEHDVIVHHAEWTDRDVAEYPAGQVIQPLLQLFVHALPRTWTGTPYVRTGVVSGRVEAVDHGVPALTRRPVRATNAVTG
jgi:hypothetical protein